MSDTARAGSETGSDLDRFADTMAQVLENCVWSQTMTHASLVPYLIEESYELVEAIEAGTSADVVEELGDVLWQVAFHAGIAARSPDEHYDLYTVARRVTEKMVRRHPHVFAGESARTPEEVVRLWSAAKAAEKHERRSVLEGVPRSLPALALADKLLGRAERVAVRPAEASDPAAFDSEDALGQALLELVVGARARGLDAEGALRARLRALEGEVARAEQA